MKKVLKIMGKVILVILAVLLLIAIILFIKNKINEKKPWLPDDYYSSFKTDSPLEQKYTLRGSIFRGSWRATTRYIRLSWWSTEATQEH